MPQRAERRFRGIPASGGLAAGPAFRLAAARAGRRAAGSPVVEAGVLRAALAATAQRLQGLRAGAEEDAADILEFQEVLLEDDDLLAPAFEAIARGTPADVAWTGRLDAEIADYAGARDPTLAARASDLADLRDQVLARLTGAGDGLAQPPVGAVVLADDLAPSVFVGLDWRRLAGAALRGGSPTSHVAILARARGVPMVVGLDDAGGIESGEALLLDADDGVVIASAEADERAAFDARRAGAARRAVEAADAAARPARSTDGEPVAVMINVDDPGLLDGLDAQTCDGIGLTRTEFLFQAGAPDEAAQLAAYRRILAWAEGRPVTVRTLDAGGDKPIPGVTVDGETNPFLGVRGLRLSLARPGPFRVQLRALARAAAEGPLKVMVPMVTVPDELAAARAHLDAVLAELAAEGVPHARPALGMMVETPAAALNAASFDAEFYSIGSNDLVQYVMAAARDNPAVAGLARPDDPAVAELIGRTLDAGRARRVEVSLCGDMASQPALIGPLLRLGIRTLSVAPAQVGRVKQAIAEARVRG